MCMLKEDPSHKQRKLRNADLVRGVLDTAGVHKCTVSETELARVNFQCGRQLPAMAGAAADAREGSPQVFARLEHDPSCIRGMEQRLDELGALKAEIDTAARDVTSEINDLRVKLGKAVSETHKTAQAHLQNPGEDPDLQRKVDLATRPLATLLATRQAEISSQRAGTVAEREASQAEKAEKDATIKQQDLKIRYLSGERIRPSDVEPASPPAPRSGRSRRR